MPVPVMTIDGDVISVSSHWTEDDSRIVTEATVRTPDGDVVVSQLGGTVDGIGMIQMPGPVILAVGMHVAVAAHKGVDLSQHEHVVLDSVRVLDFPAGYVRTGPTDGGHSLTWESGCAYVTVDAAGTKAIPMAQELAIINAAVDEWNTKTASCSNFKLMVDTSKALDVGRDYVNLIKIRDVEIPCDCPVTESPNGRAWGCRPATMTDSAHCYATGAAGITTAIYINDPKSTRDGVILDADIEINNVNFDVTASGVSASPRNPCKAELQNTLTHELGHLHGLEHTCYIQSQDPHWVDNHGNPVPSCFTPGLPATITESTMYPTQVCGETSKESLTADDVQMLCDVYPASNAQMCERVAAASGGGCCSASLGRDRSDSSLLLAGATVLLLIRRRKTLRA